MKIDRFDLIQEGMVFYPEVLGITLIIRGVFSDSIKAEVVRSSAEKQKGTTLTLISLKHFNFFRGI